MYVSTLLKKRSFPSPLSAFLVPVWLGSSGRRRQVRRDQMSVHYGHNLVFHFSQGAVANRIQNLYANTEVYCHFSMSYDKVSIRLWSTVISCGPTNSSQNHLTVCVTLAVNYIMLEKLSCTYCSKVNDTVEVGGNAHEHSWGLESYFCALGTS